jgi:arylsulfatase A-like enzyme
VARLLTKLKETPEGNGTMFDNTVLVFMSDTANQQHCWKGANWPFVLIGNLGGTLTSGQYLSYPVTRRQTWDNAGVAMGAAADGNPVTNALYTTLLHAVGKPRDTFNRSSGARDVPALYGPLRELLA